MERQRPLKGKSPTTQTLPERTHLVIQCRVRGFDFHRHSGKSVIEKPLVGCNDERSDGPHTRMGRVMPRRETLTITNPTSLVLAGTLAINALVALAPLQEIPQTARYSGSTIGRVVRIKEAGIRWKHLQAECRRCGCCSPSRSSEDQENQKHYCKS